MNQPAGALAAWSFALVTLACAGAALAADLTLPAPVEQAMAPAGLGGGTAFASGLAMLAAGWGVRLMRGRARAT